MASSMITILLSTCLLTSVTFAQEGTSFKDRFEIEGGFSLDSMLQDDESGDLKDNWRVRDVDVTASVQLSAMVRAVVRAHYESDLRVDGKGVDSLEEIDIESFLADAYIEVQEIGGRPVALVVGKHTMAHGQAASLMPIAPDLAITDYVEKTEVIGFTVALNDGFLKLVDSLEISAFETEDGDLAIGDKYGFSARATKQLSEKLTAQASYLQEQVEDSSDTRILSVGLIYNDGSFDFYAEGVLFNSEDLGSQGTDIAAVVGAAYSFEKYGQVVVELSYVENQLQQYGLGWNKEISENVTIGAEVRRTEYESDDEEDETRVGLTMSVAF